jgi:hypothetical protein
VPDLTIGYQADYFTFNNVNGSYYSGLLMPMEGPAQAVNRDLSVPTSALAALLGTIWICIPFQSSLATSVSLMILNWITWSLDWENWK